MKVVKRKKPAVPTLKRPVSTAGKDTKKVSIFDEPTPGTEGAKITTVEVNAHITKKISVDSLIQLKGSIYKLSPNKGSCGNKKCEFYCGRCPRDFNDNLICCNISDERIIFEKTKEMKKK